MHPNLAVEKGVRDLEDNSRMARAGTLGLCRFRILAMQGLTWRKTFNQPPKHLSCWRACNRTRNFEYLMDVRVVKPLNPVHASAAAASRHRHRGRIGVPAPRRRPPRPQVPKWCAAQGLGDLGLKLT